MSKLGTHTRIMCRCIYECVFLRVRLDDGNIVKKRDEIPIVIRLCLYMVLNQFHLCVYKQWISWCTIKLFVYFYFTQNCKNRLNKIKIEFGQTTLCSVHATKSSRGSFFYVRRGTIELILISKSTTRPVSMTTKSMELKKHPFFHSVVACIELLFESKIQRIMKSIIVD